MDRLKFFFQRIKGKKILLQGLGLNNGGVGTALFFLKNGVSLKVTDLKTEQELSSSLEALSYYEEEIEFVLGRHEVQDFIDAEIVIKSPAVSPDNPYILTAQAHGAEILSDLSIFMEICPTNHIIAVTGSKGKSTTVSLLYSILKETTQDVFLGGNISISPLSFYDLLLPDSWVILELSSWQLRDLEFVGAQARFPFVILTNLMNDHQNYYHSMERYLYDKLLITKYQQAGDLLFFPAGDRYFQKEMFQNNQEIFTFGVGNEADAYFREGTGYFREEPLFLEELIQIKGEAIRNNFLAAAAICYASGVAKQQEIERGIKMFKGVPFRMEKIAEKDGVSFINDTTATIPEAAVSAVKGCASSQVIWIAGGNDKNLDFSCLKEIEQIPKTIYLLKGEGTEKIKKVFSRNDLIEEESLEKIFEQLKKTLQFGDTVLLSPGCTSFGLFQNEFHRGRVFNQLVHEFCSEKRGKIKAGPLISCL